MLFINQCIGKKEECAVELSMGVRAAAGCPATQSHARVCLGRGAEDLLGVPGNVHEQYWFVNIRRLKASLGVTVSCYI